jgi:UDP-N-acetylmuramate-alanine ligase
MSGIAEILHELGYQVQGSDIAEGANVRRLRERGIEVSIPQKAENLEGVSIVRYFHRESSQIIQSLLRRGRAICRLYIALKCSVN